VLTHSDESDQKKWIGQSLIFSTGGKDSVKKDARKETNSFSVSEVSRQTKVDDLKYIETVLDEVNGSVERAIAKINGYDEEESEAIPQQNNQIAIAMGQIENEDESVLKHSNLIDEKSNALNTTNNRPSSPSSSSSNVIRNTFSEETSTGSESSEDGEEDANTSKSNAASVSLAERNELKSGSKTKTSTQQMKCPNAKLSKRQRKDARKRAKAVERAAVIRAADRSQKKKNNVDPSPATAADSNEQPEVICI